MDFNLLKTKLSSLLRGKDDRFLVVEILENSNRVAYIKANFDNKELKFIKTHTGPDLKKLLKKFGRLAQYKIILGLDSHLATTIYSSVVLVRDRFKELIDEPELDNLISQAIWKFFDRQRSRVAVKMSTSDLDVVLSDVKIRGVRLDGHKVVNPVGFKAKTVEILFSQTFLLRQFAESLKDSLPINQVVFISENGTAWANVIAKSEAAENFAVANIFPGKTLMFASSGSQNSYWDHFPWGENNLNASLAADLSVDSETAAKVIGLYNQGFISVTFKRRVEALLGRELQMLANGIGQAIKKMDTNLVFVNPSFDLPAMFVANFRGELGKPAQLRLLDLDIISKNFGFDIKFKHTAQSKNSFGLLANVLEWYLAPQDDRMSQMAKRRVRWLSPV
ncbi:MAG: hypothetical protein Q7S83_02180 [bacterium]|nr:hypothetical protein [bacterium]